MNGYFDDMPAVAYEGPDSANPFAFRHYDPDQTVLGKRMEDHLRFAVCYWHNFVWAGLDPFGGETFLRPWHEGGDPMALARRKADVAFEMFDRLGVPFFCFHDRDIAPEGATLAETNANVSAICDVFAEKMESRKVRLLWGTANMFSHRRYMAGAATNPDPEVFAYAAAQVKHCMDETHRLGGENYVLWGGREGYETLLNTDLKREMNQMGRFLSMVVDYKHKIGFKGTILIEPKPQEPTKHQYDYDTATVYGLLKAHGLENEVKVNIEVGHAVLAGHSFEHEVAMANALGIFGSVDMNRNDYQSGWDTDQFPNNAAELSLAVYHILRGGGFTTGGMNFDAKLRRQSIDAEDLILAHVGGMDVSAHALKIAAAMIEDGGLEAALDARYAGWTSEAGLMDSDLGAIAARVAAEGIEPRPRSGKQEALENYINRFV